MCLCVFKYYQCLWDARVTYSH